MEVITPGAEANQHTVEPLDADNVSWENPVLPGVSTASGDLQSYAFMFIFGAALIFFVFYIARKMQLLGDTFAANKKVLGQVRAKIGNFLANSDISNRIG